MRKFVIGTVAALAVMAGLAGSSYALQCFTTCDHYGHCWQTCR